MNSLSVTSLPLKIQSHILNYAPVQYLSACKLVCKAWKGLIERLPEVRVHEALRWVRHAKELTRANAFQEYSLDTSHTIGLAVQDFAGFSYQDRDLETITSIACIEAEHRTPQIALETIKGFLKVPKESIHEARSELTIFSTSCKTDTFCLNLLGIIKKLISSGSVEEAKQLVPHQNDYYRSKALLEIIRANAYMELHLYSSQLSLYHKVKAELEIAKTSPLQALFIPNIKKSFLDTPMSAQEQYKIFMKIATYEMESGNIEGANESFKKAYEAVDAIETTVKERHAIKLRLIAQGQKTAIPLAMSYLPEFKAAVSKSDDVDTRRSILIEIAKIESLQKPLSTQGKIAFIECISGKSELTSEAAQALAHMSEIEATIHPEAARETLILMMQLEQDRKGLLFEALLDTARALLEISKHSVRIRGKEAGLQQASTDLLEACEKVLDYLHENLYRLSEAIHILRDIAQAQYDLGLSEEAKFTLEQAITWVSHLKEKDLSSYFDRLLELAQLQLLSSEDYIYFSEPLFVIFKELREMAMGNVDYSLKLAKALANLSL